MVNQTEIHQANNKIHDEYSSHNDEIASHIKKRADVFSMSIW